MEDKKTKDEMLLDAMGFKPRYEAICDMTEKMNNGGYSNQFIPTSFSKRYDAICEMTAKMNAECDNNPKRKVTSLAKWKRLFSL